MPSPEDIENQQNLLATYRRTLAHLLDQAAQFSGEVFAPPQNANAIHEARQKIRQIKATLRSWNVTVDDLPDDEKVIHRPLTPSSEAEFAPRLLRVFLCHSSGDKIAVRELYKRLISDGFKPWLDEEDLLIGVDWNIAIQKAIRASDLVIVCLSQTSTTKAGFVQKEIKYALDKSDEQPEGTIFIIPLKLEECDVPDRLRQWQWVDYFDARGYERLVRSLRERAKAIQPNITRETESHIHVSEEQPKPGDAPTEELNSKSNISPRSDSPFDDRFEYAGNSFAWNEIEVYVYSIGILMGSSISGTTYSRYVQGKDQNGRIISIVPKGSTTVTKYDQIRDADANILHVIHNKCLKNSMEQFYAGGTIDFGNIHVNRNGLTLINKLFSWDDILKIDYEVSGINSDVSLNTIKGKIIIGYTHYTPNIDVLRRMVNDIAISNWSYRLLLNSEIIVIGGVEFNKYGIKFSNRMVDWNKIKGKHRKWLKWYIDTEDGSIKVEKFGNIEASMFDVAHYIVSMNQNPS